MRHWRTFVAIGFFLFFSEQYVHKTITSRLPILNSAPCDFLPYFQAAQHIVHGESPFLADGYIYPPLLAFLLTPLARFDYLTARWIWFGASQLFLIAAAVLLWRRFGRDWPSACLIACVWALGGAAAEALAVGQVGLLLLFLIALAMTTRQGERGFTIGLGFALKLFPGLLGLAVLLRRERRGLRSMLITAASALALPWIAVICFLRGPAGLGKGGALAGTPATLSWSVPSLFLRVVDPARRKFLLPNGWLLGTDLQHFRLPPHLALAALAVSVLTLAAGVLILVRATGLQVREEQVPWAMAALVSLALLASPVSWTHYQVLQYPGVALLLIYAWKQRQWPQLATVLALAGLLHPVPIRFFDWVSHTPWKDSYLAPLYFWDTVPTITTAVFFSMFVTRAGRAVSARAPRQRMQVLPGYSRLPESTPLVPLHSGPPAPSREVSSR